MVLGPGTVATAGPEAAGTLPLAGTSSATAAAATTLLPGRTRAEVRAVLERLPTRVTSGKAERRVAAQRATPLLPKGAVASGGVGPDRAAAVGRGAKEPSFAGRVSVMEQPTTEQL